MKLTGAAAVLALAGLVDVVAAADAIVEHENNIYIYIYVCERERQELHTNCNFWC
jgi:hypothetical protein